MNKHNHISYTRYALQHSACFLKVSGKLLRVEIETHQGCPHFHEVPYCFHTAQRSNHILMSMNQPFESTTIWLDVTKGAVVANGS
jgi:hypothetical protein